MACFDKWDIGACGCAAPGVTCVTCTGTIPTTLYVTDVNSGGVPYTLTWNSGLNQWITSGLCTPSIANVAACVSATCSCTGGGGNGLALYTYAISCSSANHMAVIRTWYELTCGANHYYCPCACTSLGLSSPAISEHVFTVTCGSVHGSSALAQLSGNLTDPVGGTVSFTQ